MIRDYLRELESLLATRPWVASIEVVRSDVTELDDLTILLYRFRVTLKDGGLLEMMERVVSERSTFPRHTTYRFHWQDAEGHLLRRWDNAPHHPSLPGFPHHVHIAEETNVEESKPVTGLELLREVDRLTTAGET